MLVNSPPSITDFTFRVTFRHLPELNFIIEFEPNSAALKHDLFWCEEKCMLNEVQSYLKERSKICAGKEKERWKDVSMCVVKNRFGRHSLFRYAPGFGRYTEKGFIVAGEFGRFCLFVAMYPLDQESYVSSCYLQKNRSRLDSMQALREIDSL